MEKCGVIIDELALAGGGAKTSGWPEIIAAVCEKPVAIYNAEETVTTVL
jgi:sugar (pentulose or hexulose) kinase